MPRISQSRHQSLLLLAKRLSGSQIFNVTSCTRAFTATRHLGLVKSYRLADIGEGIVECQINSWFVKPGDHVEQFERLCEVQSDKASVEITSPFDGIVQTLHYEVDGMAKVGLPLIDIEVDDSSETEDTIDAKDPTVGTDHQDTTIHGKSDINDSDHSISLDDSPIKDPEAGDLRSMLPSVRLLLKKHNLNPSEIQPTGKGGRLLKEDVQRHVETSAVTNSGSDTHHPRQKRSLLDVKRPLGPIEQQMFRSMSNSLAIPHLYYTHIVDLTEVTSLRNSFAKSTMASGNIRERNDFQGKLTALPIIAKALSEAFLKFPNMNATLDTELDTRFPTMVLRSSHNFGMAIDTSRGLMVPVIRNVEEHSIISLAKEIDRLSRLAQENSLRPDDFQGASFVISNIGSLGGHTVGPVILPPMVGIVGIGKSERVPSVWIDANGNEQIGVREKVALSWSADHRVLDGATVARCARFVSTWLEDIGMLSLVLR